jgi:hypothetical protein
MQGRVTRGPLVATGVLVLLALAGCGSEDDSKTPSDAPAKRAEQRAPDELLGKYTTELKQSDLPPSPPGELTPGSMRWTLTIANSGGIDNGPVFAIANSGAGSLENPSFGVKDDLILLHHEECAAGDKPFYENQYRYELSGKTLTLTKVKNSCPDEVALTILTSEPWTKVK